MTAPRTQAALWAKILSPNQTVCWARWTQLLLPKHLYRTSSNIIKVNSINR